MPINYRFLVDNLGCLLPDDLYPPKDDAIREAFEQKNASEIAELLCLIARDIQARSSMLPFGDGHELGLDPPNRKLGMATRYMDEIGRTLGGRPLDSHSAELSFDELGWHAFGAAIQAIAGILEHIDQVPKKPD